VTPSTPTKGKKRVGLIGARGFVGAELLALLDNDPSCEVVFVTSKGAAGQRLGAHTLQDLSPEDVVAAHVDGVVLGLQNGQAAPWVKALDESAKDSGEGVVVVDLSADHRFVTGAGERDWKYGLVEKNRAALRGARRIANPGCYSTAAQLALWPFHDIIERAHIFGVSGYSGAGSTPSKKNDLAVLRDNLLPYDLVGHTQEKEMAQQSGLDVRFLPHVAPFFRGISCTIAIDLKREIALDEAQTLLTRTWQHEQLIDVSDDEPLVAHARGRHTVGLGGLRVQGRRLVVVAVIDNLLKGAATQALQNLHLGLGLDELSGIDRDAVVAAGAPVGGAEPRS